MNFPEDLLTDILRRLPVESVLRCMCVCKTWYHLILTPFFVKIHLNYHKNTDKYLLYQTARSCTLLTDTDLLFDFTKHSKLYYTPHSFRTPVFPHRLDTRLDALHVHGVCDGLLCLSDELYCKISSGIYLWNPLCRKAKKLPKLEISYVNANRKVCRVTSGYCGVTLGYYDNDYKVIGIAFVENAYIVSVYSLSTHTWNIINTNFFNNDAGVYLIYATKFVNTTAYVLTWGREIICFQLCDESIRVIKFPDEFRPDLNADVVNLEEYREEIALLTCDKKYFTMWTLRDGSSSASPLEKKFSVELQEPVSRRAVSAYHQAVGFLNNGKYLVRTWDSAEEFCVTRLFWCDLENPELTEFRSVIQPGHRLEDPKYRSRIHCIGAESLVLLNEDNLDPLVNMDMESCCSSMLFTLKMDNKWGDPNHFARAETETLLLLNEDRLELDPFVWIEYGLQVGRGRRLNSIINTRIHL